jgi:signal peptidase
MTTAVMSRPRGETRPSDRPSLLGRTARWFATTLGVLAVLGCGFVIAGGITQRWTILSVPTGSMRPTITPGSGIVVVPQRADDVTVGDVIVFHAPGTGSLTVHRVVQIDVVDGERQFQTKGDANPARDPWKLRIDKADVGHVTAVLPSLGSVTDLMRDTTFRLALAALGAGLVLGVGVRAIWGGGRPEDEDAETGLDDAGDDRAEPVGSSSVSSQ